MLKFDQRFSCLNEIAVSYIHLHDLAVKLRLNHQLHLHRLHRDYRLALLRNFSWFFVQLGDGARHWGLAEAVGGSLLLNHAKLIRFETET